jgi:hypothetical protein
MRDKRKRSIARVQIEKTDSYRIYRRTLSPDEIAMKIFQPVSTGCLFSRLLRTPMCKSSESAEPTVFEAIPCYISDISIEGDGYIYKNEELDRVEGQVLTPFLKRPVDETYSSTSLVYTGSPSTPTLDSTDTKHSVGSLLELMKAVGWTDEGLDDSLDERSPADRPSPRVAASLFSKDLAHLIERVSREDTPSQIVNSPDALAFRNSFRKSRKRFQRFFDVGFRYAC